MNEQERAKIPAQKRGTKAPAQKSILQRASVKSESTDSVPPIVNDALNSPGEPLDAETRALMEPRFGHDFSQVQVHTDEKAAESARAVNALAYTVGQDVVFDAGRYKPKTNEGKRLLAHELTHVVQQNEAISVAQEDLAQSIPEDASEREADALSVQITQTSVSDREGAGVRNAPFKTTAGVSAQQLQSQQNPSKEKQSANIDDAIFHWTDRKVIDKINYEYSNAVTDVKPVITGFKIWKLALFSGELDEDIFFKQDGATEERHVKLIVRIITTAGKVTAIASLYDWLGPIPVEIAHWEGVAEQEDGTWKITDKPAPAPAPVPKPPGHTPRKGKGESGIA